MKLLRVVICAAAVVLLAGNPSGAARASPVAPLYSQPANPAGGLLLSSLRDPDGSPNDQWIWDAFVLAATSDIADVRWSGGYDPSRFGSGGAVANFTVSIYASVPGISQPDIAHPPLVRYEVGGNAGETPGSVLGGVQMYDYAYSLPTTFHAQGGTKYWVQIEAYQPGALPDWGLTRGTGGDGSHFRKVAGETQYQTVPGDTTFSLLGTQAALLRLYLPVIFR
jgi:hypothetical protein